MGRAGARKRLFNSFMVHWASFIRPFPANEAQVEAENLRFRCWCAPAVCSLSAFIPGMMKFVAWKKLP